MIRFGALGALLLGLARLVLETAVAAEPLTVYTVNYPLAYFAERIAGEHAQVEFPAPADLDPAFWRPEADVIGAYQRADLILLNGASYAKWIGIASLPRSRLVNTSKAFSERYIPVEETRTHSHGSEGEHSHAGTAWTTWLDFEQAMQQARAVAEALERKRPELASSFADNLQALERDLEALDRQLTELSQRDPELLLVASHPVYQYLARRYQLQLESVQWEPEEVPDEAQWSEFEGLLREHPARWMLWEGVPDPESVARLEALGVNSIVFDPAANRPTEGDFLSVMEANVADLAKAFD